MIRRAADVYKHLGASSLEDLPKIHAGLATREGYTVHASDARLEPYVNVGRWVADCPCGAGVALTPGDGRAWCFQCGAVFSAVAWPKNAATIDRLLSARPVERNRNWRASETVEDLRAQNAEHGVKED